MQSFDNCQAKNRRNKKRRSKTSSSRALSDSDLLPITLFADKLLQIGVRTLSSYYAKEKYLGKTNTQLNKWDIKDFYEKQTKQSEKIREQKTLLSLVSWL